MKMSLIAKIQIQSMLNVDHEAILVLQVTIILEEEGCNLVKHLLVMVMHLVSLSSLNLLML